MIQPVNPEPGSPSRHDAVTITCPICQHPFTPNGRRTFCSDACRAAAKPRPRDTQPTNPTNPPTPPPTPINL
jgi:hypothetical protein